MSKQWLPALRGNDCRQVCGGLPFLGLLPKGTSLQCKTEVEIKLVALKCKTKLFKAFKKEFVCCQCYQPLNFKGIFVTVNLKIEMVLFFKA